MHRSNRRNALVAPFSRMAWCARYRRTEDVRIRVYGDAAVVTGVQHVNATVNGKDIEAHLRYLHVFAKPNGQWVVVARQATLSVAARVIDDSLYPIQRSAAMPPIAGREGEQWLPGMCQRFYFEPDLDGRCNSVSL